MDAMALLCNLHADGPATLRTLRESGCSSLDELASLPVERLVELLGFTPAAARRFLREGVSLRERLGAEALEREEDLQVPAVAAALGLGAADAGRLPAREQELLAKVMRRWREADCAEGGAAGVAGGAARPDAAAGAARTALARTDALVPGDLDGLDQDVCRRLAAAGVASLAGLAACVPETVAPVSGLAYSRVRRLQFLARRRTDHGQLSPFPPPAALEPVEERISLAFPVRPIPALGGETRGGPFA